MTVLLDWAGARIGGAKRLLDEFDAYATDHPDLDLDVIGRNRRLTSPWLARREAAGGSPDRAVAFNNISFQLRGREKVVLVHGPLLFLTAPELHELGRLIPPSVRLQAKVARAALRRADLAVVPAASMAERVARAVPAVADRVVVRANPVSDLTVSPAAFPATDRDFLCPIIVSGPKLMTRRLRVLVAAADLLAAEGHDVRVLVTATPREVGPDLRTHPRLRLIGRQRTEEARDLMKRCAGVAFPTELESFGYPLAEARILRRPVVALDSAHNREIAGDALVGYERERSEDVAAAMATALTTRLPAAKVDAFDRTRYFDFLLGRAG